MKPNFPCSLLATTTVLRNTSQSHRDRVNQVDRARDRPKCIFESMHSNRMRFGSRKNGRLNQEICEGSCLATCLYVCPRVHVRLVSWSHHHKTVTVCRRRKISAHNNHQNSPTTKRIRRKTQRQTERLR